MEDVDFMIKHSQKDSITMFIDSSLRDKLTYHTPSEYSIELEQPIRNVYGIEVMDATIPVSMYNVDVHNDLFAFTQVFYTAGNNTAGFLARMAEFEYNSYFNKLFSALYSSLVFICVDESDFADIMATGSSVIPTNNIVLMRKEYEVPSMRVIDAKYKPNDNEYAFMFKTTRFVVSTTESIITLIKSGDIAVLPSSMTQGGYKVIYYEHGWIVENRADIILADFTTAPKYEFVMRNVVARFEHGNYDGLTLYQYILALAESITRDEDGPEILGSHSIKVTQTASFGTITKQTKLRWESIGPYPFILDMKKSTIREVLGFPNYSVDYEQNDYVKVNHHDNHQLFMSKAIPVMAEDTGAVSHILQQLNAPGIMALLGARFILLRIPEIENHLLNSFATSRYSTGVGMFKLAGGNDVTHLRFDFVNLVKKPFHPIGKLSKMTIRFEMASGQLYDFKGVDHNLLLNIKFYAPNNPITIPKSILNPNYDQDVLRFLINNGSAVDMDKVRVQEIEESPSHHQEFMREQRKYDYSSDESSEDF